MWILISLIVAWPRCLVVLGACFGLHTIRMMFIIYLITSTIWWGTHNRVRLQFKCVLVDNPPPPAQGKLTTPQWSMSPTLFEQWCGFFYVPREPEKRKCCETGPTVFRPLPRRLESLTVCRCHCKGSTFSSVILKTLSVGPAGVWTRELPLSRPVLSQLCSSRYRHFCYTKRVFIVKTPSQ